MTDLAIELIIFGILTRLTAKDVVKCKTVCKDWCALLSTKEFEQAHCSKSSYPGNQRTLFIHDSICTVYKIDFPSGNYASDTQIPFPIQPGIKNVGVLAHLDGLLCAYLLHTNELIMWNPTTNAYKHLSTSDGRGIYEDISDTLGLYKDPSNDYNVIHVTRMLDVIDAYIYSKRARGWRKIQFKTNNAYASRTFYWSPGTICNNIVYFTVCECWVGGINVLIAFDTKTEQLNEISFPPVRPLGIFHGILINVQTTLHMVLTAGVREMTFELWALQGERWVSIYLQHPIPPIPLDSWVTITHYMTNGMWFVMNGANKMYEITVDNKHLERFYPVNWFRGHNGAVYIQTVVSP